MNPLLTPPFTAAKVLAVSLLVAFTIGYLIYRRIQTGKWLE